MPEIALYLCGKEKCLFITTAYSWPIFRKTPGTDALAPRLLQLLWQPVIRGFNTSTIQRRLMNISEMPSLRDKLIYLLW
jgi:hypothetical protein